MPVQLCLCFLGAFGGTVDISRVSPPVTPNHYLAGRRQLLISNPSLFPLRHAFRTNVVVRLPLLPPAGLPRFWSPRSPSHIQRSPGLNALFDLWMSSKCLCSQSRSNRAEKMATVGMSVGERVWHCAEMKLRSMLEEGRTPSGHPELGGSRHLG